MPTALLDACVLYPMGLRDTLLRLAQAQAYRPLWSAQILAEVRNALVRSALGVQPARADRLLATMRAAFPEAMVTGHLHMVPEMGNEPADRHVLAAAVAGRANGIVTFNLRHFPSSVCAPFGVEARSPDDFLTALLGESADRVLEGLQRQVARYDAPPMTMVELVSRHEARLPEFVSAVRALMG